MTMRLTGIAGISILLSALSISASAQTGLTLDAAIHKATELNPTLRRARYDVAAADADIVTAGLRPNPQLNVNGDLFSTSAPILTPEAKQYGINLSMPFELGGKRTARIANADAQKKVAEASARESERSVALAVSDGWHDVAQAARTLEIVRKARITFDSLVAVNRVRLRNQVITPTELTRSQIAAQQYTVEEHQAEFELGRARQRLGTLIGTMEPVSIEEHVDTTAIAEPVDTLVALALRRRSDLEGYATAVEASRTNEQLQQAIAAPDVSVSLDYMRQQGIPFYGLSATVPLQFFSRNQGEIEKSTVLRQQAEMTLDAARRQIAAEVRLAYDDYLSHRASLQALGEVLAASENVRSTVEYAYRSGNTTILDFLDAQRTWFDTQKAWDGALVDYRRSKATLAILTGSIPND